MECERCGRKLEGGWNFCPFCGFRPGRTPQVFGGPFGGIMDKLMKRLAKQMEDIDRQTADMEQNFEVMDLSPLFRDLNMIDDKVKIIGKPNARGFTIKISSGTGEDPKVDVKTFGNVDDKSLQKQVNEQLHRMGISGPVKISVRHGQGLSETRPGQNVKERERKKKPKQFPIPKTTEEPKTSVRRIDSRVYVDMDMPGVKSEEDININELESSVEVRASAGDKAYFKILTKPAQFRLEKKEFKGSRLHLEFA